MAPALLEMRNISKTFAGVRVLSKVSFSVIAGEVHALLGENGAGKSTLMKILSGAYQADAGGEIVIAGERADIDSPLAGRQAGISTVYQELSLCPNLTVAENIALGLDESPRGGKRKALHASVASILRRLGADFGPQSPVSTLSIAQRQLVEISRALHGNSKVVVFDEPTTALSANETDRLFSIIRQLRGEGLAIIYISHRIERDAGLGGVLRQSLRRRQASEAFQTLRIRASSHDTPAGALSGGNQQKVLLSRLLATSPRAIILDEPTRGVDVGAKSEIYTIIDGLAKRGVGVLVISSDLPELVGISDRILVMREGRIAGEVAMSGSAEDIQLAVMELAAGVAGLAA
jgi:ABC-type sugar transport system ATPase subunit